MELGSLVQGILVGVGLSAAAGAFGVRRVARGRRSRTADRAMEQGSFAVLADPEVGFEGLKAAGGARSRWRRGTGVLVLSERQIRYSEFLPSYRLEIQLKYVRAVETGTSFLGKERARKVLTVHFADSSGKQADVGFSMQDPNSWAIQIRKRMPS